MTYEQIIKALKCCADEYIHSCDYCPFEKECNGDNLNLVKYALDLINRQKSEIEKLNTVNADMHESLRLACERNKDLQAEIERLKLITTNKPYCVSIGTADIFTENHEEYEWLLAKISAEAIKEFAERLKEESLDVMNFVIPEEVVCVDDIDNLVKEMVGDTE